MKVLLTGAAGFIGYFTACKLLDAGADVIGIDNINDYYEPALKYARLSLLGINSAAIVDGEAVKSSLFKNFTFVKMDLENRSLLSDLFAKEKFNRVCSLAAQAGVRYSLENPFAYIDSNIVGFANLLECCRRFGIEHLVFASSSSVYGLNRSMPFKISDTTDSPASLYAATKKSNELMAHVYSHLFKIPCTGLRFFTVYGPLGRPDMAYFSFTKNMLEGNPIDIYNNGDMLRDFTYIDDIVEGVARVLELPPKTDLPYKLYNIGCSSPVKLMDFIDTIERALGVKAKKNFLPMQAGDVYATYADVTDLIADTGYAPHISIDEGIERFVKWYREFYGYPVS